MLINAGGPWVEDIIKNMAPTIARRVTTCSGQPYHHAQIISARKMLFLSGRGWTHHFTIPYENDFTLIGTTDVDHPDLATPPVCSDEETDYLLAFASSYFETPVKRSDIVASFSGVRPLYNDGAGNASAATRDYVLRLEDEEGLPLLNIFGGKITTYRKLAESVMKEIGPFFDKMSGSWTATEVVARRRFLLWMDFEQLVTEIKKKYSFLPEGVVRRLARAYGTDTWLMLAQINSADELGDDFGAGSTHPNSIGSLSTSGYCQPRTLCGAEHGWAYA